LALNPDNRAQSLISIVICLGSLQSGAMRFTAYIFAAVGVAFAAPCKAHDRPQVRIVFDAKRIINEDARGLADPGTGRAVTIDDPVRIASVSKLFVALGVMRLVDTGKLNLDRDVSDYLGWKLRNPAFPDRHITLRLLLSHQSSVSDAAEYVIPLDQTLRAKMADPKAWDAEHAPGSGWFHYTNLNFPIVASVMEAATGERFDRLMHWLVMKPLKLSACFNWSPCIVDQAKRAVVLYRSTGEVARDDLKGALPTCPVVPASDGSCDLARYTPGWNGSAFSPQGGLRISARDLAKTGQMLMRKGRGFLSAKSFAELTGPQWRFDGANGKGETGLSENGFFCAYGLAVQTLANAGCKDDPFGDGAQRIGHSGEAYGLKSGLWVDPKSKRGVAFFITGVPDDAPRGTSAFYAVEEELLARPVKARR
jgi:CubicO group peptidase (beta-lactamase class C family)